MQVTVDQASDGYVGIWAKPVSGWADSCKSCKQLQPLREVCQLERLLFQDVDKSSVLSECSHDNAVYASCFHTQSPGWYGDLAPFGQHFLFQDVGSLREQTIHSHHKE